MLSQENDAVAAGFLMLGWRHSPDDERDDNESNNTRKCDPPVIEQCAYDCADEEAQQNG
jgi:hypothetical protein